MDGLVRKLKALGFSVLFILGFYILEIGLSVFSLMGFARNGYNLSAVYLMALVQIIKIFILYFFIKKRSKGYKEKHKMDYVKTKPTIWPKAFLIGLGAYGLANIIMSTILALFGNTPLIIENMEFLNEAFSVSSLLENILLYIDIIILAPIVEEMIFRGIYVGEVRKYISINATIFMSGLFFGIFHMNLLQGINAFFLGGIITYVYFRRGNIYEAIIIHATNNLLASLSEISDLVNNITIIGGVIGLFFTLKIIRHMERYYKSVS
ncbi:MAG: type II CAAX endopeptidase family protein [Peptoniphilaceae bacterium]|nr:type II CAAX endopeptidase family protein [Peptoniphilaceae bacterium]